METERILGRMEEFKEWSKTEFRQVHERLYLLSHQIEKLNEERWVNKGKLMVVMSIVIIGVEFTFKKLLGMN